MKRKSRERLQAGLWNSLRPDLDLATLANEITHLLDTHAGTGARNVNIANNMATYLIQKYSVTKRNSGKLHNLIQHHPEDFAEFLNQILFKEIQLLLKNGYRLPRREKKTRAKPKIEAERAQGLKRSKNKYEERRREYRAGLIMKEFGQSQVSDPYLPLPRPTGPCLDILLRGGAVHRSGDRNSLENLFGVDRHRFPKSLHPKRNGRNLVYDISAFLDCLVHLLKNRSAGQQWPPKPWDRKLVLIGIIERVRRLSSKAADMLAEELRPFLS